MDYMLENCCNQGPAPHFTQNLPSHQYNGDTLTYNSWEFHSGMLQLLITMNVNTFIFKFLDGIASFAQKEKQYMLREHDEGWPSIYYTYIKIPQRFLSYTFWTSCVVLNRFTMALKVQLCYLQTDLLVELIFFIHTKKMYACQQPNSSKPRIPLYFQIMPLRTNTYAILQ